MDWIENIEIEKLDQKSVFVYCPDKIELQFRNAESINQNLDVTPFNILSTIINNVAVLIINIVVLVCLKHKV